MLWPGLFLFLPFTKRTRVLVQSGKSIVLVKGALSEHTWGLPGGGLHRNEDPLEGALRELREETGIVAEPAQLTRLYSGWHKEGLLRFYSHFYLLRLPAMVPLTKQRFEIADIRWQPTAELLHMRTRAEVRRALELLPEQG